MFSYEDFIYLFLERGREGEREEEKHQCVAVSCTPPTGDLAHNQGMCPDWELNWWPFGSQVCAQSTEPHQPGQSLCFNLTFKLLFHIRYAQKSTNVILKHKINCDSSRHLRMRTESRVVQLQCALIPSTAFSFRRNRYPRFIVPLPFHF